MTLGGPDLWLPLFLAANGGVTLILIPGLGVQAPRYQALPVLFLLGALLSVPTRIRARLLLGAWPWRMLPPLLYLAAISIASSVSPHATVSVEGNVFHPVEYAGLSLLVQAALHRGLRIPPRPLLVLGGILLCVALGGVDELHQAFVPGRASTLLDVGLDALGALLGAGVFLALDRIAGVRLRAPC